MTKEIEKSFRISIQNHGKLKKLETQAEVAEGSKIDSKYFGIQETKVKTHESGAVRENKGMSPLPASSHAMPEFDPTHTEVDVTNASTRPSNKCCLCWCCCCSCSCSGVRNNQQSRTKAKESESDTNLNPELTPPLEEIRSWGESFENLMKSTTGRKVFRDFLRCEYSEENILFWLACEELRKERKPELVEEKARLIYEDYISILSPKEVSLDSRVRELVNQNMVDPSPHTFDEAQVQIYTLMHRDSYPRFVNSVMFKKLAQLNVPHRGSSVSTSGVRSTPASRKESLAI